VSGMQALVEHGMVPPWSLSRGGHSLTMRPSPLLVPYNSVSGGGGPPAGHEHLRDVDHISSGHRTRSDTEPHRIGKHALAPYELWEIVSWRRARR